MEKQFSVNRGASKANSYQFSSEGVEDADLLGLAERCAVRAPQREERRRCVAQAAPGQRVEGHERRRLHQKAIRRQHHLAAQLRRVPVLRGAGVHHGFHRVRAFAEDGALHLAVGGEELMLRDGHLGGDLVQRGATVFKSKEKLGDFLGGLGSSPGVSPTFASPPLRWRAKSADEPRSVKSKFLSVIARDAGLTPDEFRRLA